MGAPQTTSVDEMPAVGRRHEVLGIVCASATLLVGLSLWSYDADGGSNWIGPVGAGLAGVLATAFGVAAWLVPIELALATARLFSKSTVALGVGRVASTVVIVLVGCAMVHLALPGETVFGGHMPGGLLGEVLGEVLRSLLGLAGSFVVGSAVILITIVLRTPFSVIKSARSSALAVVEAGRRGRDWSRQALDAWREAKEIERLEREEAERAAAPKIVSDTLDGEDDNDADPVVFTSDEAESVSDAELEELAEAEPVEEVEEPPPLPKARAKKAKAPKAAPKAAAKATPKAAPKKRAVKVAAPTIVAPVARQQSAIKMPEYDGDFELPPVEVFDEPPSQAIRVDAATLRENARQLTEKLEAYRVKGRVDEIHPGPVVTMYEFEPESGTKISKIAGLSDDLAMALAAHKVRIVAPIPGKARVGFELPNEDRQTVYMREVIEDPRWHSLKASLPVAFGKDIAGQPVYGDLAKMPHLLVAGATGSGKSVGLNVMLCSLLSRRTPDEVRMLMIDPKVVELAVFDGIPHMLLPVVTDMKKAALALRWAVDEMERRYQLFADAGARNISTYNQRVDKVIAGEMPAEKLFRSRKGKVKATNAATGQEELLDPVDGESPDAIGTPERLPYIVVVVDEFADLMMVAAKDVEAAIARLAQKARAAGIHVILATQRPSVDVITGMIKANFPARIAFKVSQREDSKTILGRNGAEHLLGMGDMLMIPPGSSDLRRVHSAYVSEDEVKRLCDQLREQGKPVYDEKILEPRADDGGKDGKKSDDPVYDRAVACVAQAGYCSISHIQRQLSVGYNKAAKLVDRMEKEGVVGPASSKAGGRREVLITAL